MAITNVTLIDGTGAGPRVVSVIIEGDRITTRSAAEFLGRLPEEGTVEVGKKANLVLLEANPLTDIANTRKVAAVVLRGRFISAEELQRHR
ncbi:MAG TPA: amidohydrolase family protein [Vicinamibacterales bacterium]|nr:amidohydrolase family protein [Vicinamibacterales bacterium]